MSYGNGWVRQARGSMRADQSPLVPRHHQASSCCAVRESLRIFARGAFTGFYVLAPVPLAPHFEWGPRRNPGTSRGPEWIQGPQNKPSAWLGTTRGALGVYRSGRPRTVDPAGCGRHNVRGCPVTGRGQGKEIFPFFSIKRTDPVRRCQSIGPFLPKIAGGLPILV